ASAVASPTRARVAGPCSPRSTRVCPCPCSRPPSTSGSSPAARRNTPTSSCPRCASSSAATPSSRRRRSRVSREIEPTVEHLRVRSGRPDGPLHELGPWALWGPYLAERAWGTVREDYSATGEAWTYFPHDHARSRAYRWNEYGMAGICDLEQRLCLAL